MKKIKLLSLALIAIFNLCSCEDDDTQSFTETDIAGT